MGEFSSSFALRRISSRLPARRPDELGGLTWSYRPRLSTEPKGAMLGGGGAGDFFLEGLLGGLLGEDTGVALVEEVLDPDGDLASELKVCNIGGDDIRRAAFSSPVSGLPHVEEHEDVTPGGVGAWRLFLERPPRRRPRRSFCYTLWPRSS